MNKNFIDDHFIPVGEKHVFVPVIQAVVSLHSEALSLLQTLKWLHNCSLLTRLAPQFAKRHFPISYFITLSREILEII